MGTGGRIAGCSLETPKTMETTMNIPGKRIAILATHGFEQSELEVPLKRLKEAGATVDVVSPESGEIKGWEMKDWGHPLRWIASSLMFQLTTTMRSTCLEAGST